MKTALLIIDIQNDYFPGGRRELVNPMEAARKAYSLLQCFREHKQKTVHIQHISTRPGADVFLPGTSGAHIHDSVAHFEDEPLVIKHHPNSFRETNLQELLTGWGIERLVITGMQTHMCVEATARAAADLGYQVLVAEDACATRELSYDGTMIPADHVHKTALASLTHYGRVMTADQVIATLAAEHERESKTIP